MVGRLLCPFVMLNFAGAKLVRLPGSTCRKQSVGTSWGSFPGIPGIPGIDFGSRRGFTNLLTARVFVWEGQRGADPNIAMSKVEHFLNKSCRMVGINL